MRIAWNGTSRRCWWERCGHRPIPLPTGASPDGGVSADHLDYLKAVHEGREAYMSGIRRSP
eukprot:8513659-Alexandrium_andersonii.AAC.1